VLLCYRAVLGLLTLAQHGFCFLAATPSTSYPSIAGKGGAAIRSPARSRENQYTLSRSFLYPGSTNQKHILAAGPM